MDDSIKIGKGFENDFRLWYKTLVKKEMDDGEEVSYTVHEYINVVQFPPHLREENEKRILDLNNEEVEAVLLFLTDVNSEVLKTYN